MNDEAESAPEPDVQAKISDMVYVGLKGRVAALFIETGDIVWEWRSPDSSGYVSLLVEGERLIVSVDGYTYGLDALDGEELWRQPLSGYGVGPPSLATVNSRSADTLLSQAAAVSAENARSVH